MLSYYGEITSNELTYSCDMLVFKGVFIEEVECQDFWGVKYKTSFLDAFEHMLYLLNDCGELDYNRFENFSLMRYKFMYDIFLKDAHFRCSFGFNGYHSSDNRNYRIEFNPNKCMSVFGSSVQKVLSWIFFRSYSHWLDGMDIAVDIPIVRSDVFMLKDKRKYQLILNSTQDKTEYLGVRHDNGFCKLYNKTIESDLPYNLTRFEITFVLGKGGNLSISEIIKKLPKVAYYVPKQVHFKDSELSGTDSVILEALLYDSTKLTQLSRRMRDKFEKILSDYIVYLDISADIIMQLYCNMGELV